MSPTILTNRLEIKRFTEADTAQYAEIMTNPAVTKYLGTGEDKTKEDVERLLKRLEDVWNKNDYGVFVVKEAAGGNIIGHCGFLPFADDRIELLYAYDPSAWGKGYATEAGRAVLDYAKNRYDWAEVCAITYPQNVASATVLKKLGFKPIGREEHFGLIFEVFTYEMRRY